MTRTQAAGDTLRNAIVVASAAKLKAISKMCVFMYVGEFDPYIGGLHTCAIFREEVTKRDSTSDLKFGSAIAVRTARSVVNASRIVFFESARVRSSAMNSLIVTGEPSNSAESR